MRNKKLIASLLMVGLFFALGATNQAQAYDEARVRYILVDISLGGSISYYRDYPENPNAVEALRRWENGVRVVNLEQFERDVEDGGPGIVYAGTCDVINGMDVDLNTDYDDYYVQPRVRLHFPDIRVFVPHFPGLNLFHPGPPRHRGDHRDKPNRPHRNEPRPPRPPQPPPPPGGGGHNHEPQPQQTPNQKPASKPR